MGVGPGDEVVVPSFTFYASAEAIPPTGATPVFCDIDPDTYCVTAETVRAALTPRTKAVDRRAPVRQRRAGRRDRGARRARARGRRAGRSARTPRAGRAGALGTAATFSFYPSKNLGCFGDGGHDRHLRRADRRAGAHPALPRLARQGRLRAARLQLAPGRAAGGDPARAAAAPRRLGRRAPRGRRATTSRPASASSSGCPCPRPAPRRRGTCTSSAIRASSAWKPRCGAAGIGHKPYYRTPVHRQAPMRRVGRRARAAGDRAGRGARTSRSR